ncbi:MAG: HAMP domain-containing protein, partial [Chloroflexi bacterium]|nr:HAMP domain-containing protein [Chloroflexota bacterium]
MWNKLRLHGLRLRLLATQLLVVAVGVSLVAFLARQGTRGVIHRISAFNAAREGQIVAGLLGEASRSGNLSQAEVESLGRNFGVPIMLVSPAGAVLASSDDPQSVGTAFSLQPPPGAIRVSFEAQPAFVVLRFPTGDIPLKGQPDAIRWVAAAEPSSVSGVVVAETAKVPVPPPNIWRYFFFSLIDRSFLFSMSAALILTAILSIGLSRRIVGPVEQLTAAVRRMEKGDLQQRVNVNSKDEIGALAHAFNAMADGLSRAEGLRRNMVTDVAHELRTPLSTVRGYLEAMRDGAVAPSPTVIESLHEETLLLSRLIDDLQELALAEAGQLRLNRQPMALGEVIAGASTAVLPQAQSKAIALENDVPADLPPVNADPERIGQVLRNLLTNAVAHTPNGGRIIVSARASGGSVEVRVKDTG